jgi:hypothetical protein
MNRTALILALSGVLAAGAGAQSIPEKLIEAGHWKRARVIVEARWNDNRDDALSNFLMSQIRNAFGDRESPPALAERAVAIDGGVAKYHRQLAEALGVEARHSGIFHQIALARRFKKEIDIAIVLDPRDLQALRDLLEFYLLAPGIAGGDKGKARIMAEQIGRINAASGYSAQARLAIFNGEKDTVVEALLRRAVDAEPGNYRARTALASFYADHANAEGAEREALQAVQIDAGRAEGYAILAEIDAAAGRWGDLDSALTAAEKEVPDDLAPFYRAGEALLRVNRSMDRAVRYFQKYAGGQPEGNAPTVADAQGKLEFAAKGFPGRRGGR